MHPWSGGTLWVSPYCLEDYIVYTCTTTKNILYYYCFCSSYYGIDGDGRETDGVESINFYRSEPRTDNPRRTKPDPNLNTT
jgi:hypothetical protein